MIIFIKEKYLNIDLKILLLGDLSGVHKNLQIGLNECGYIKTTLATSGDGFKNIRGDINLPTLKDFSIPSMFEMTRFFSKVGKSEYLLPKGNAGGQLLAQINPNGDISLARCDVQLKDVSLQHAKTQAEIGVDELIFRAKNSLLGALKGEFKKVFLKVGEQESSQFTCAEMSGEVKLTEEKELLIDCFGVLLEKDTKVPFNILGDGFFLGKDNGKVGLNVNL